MLSNGLGKSWRSWLAQHEKQSFKRVSYGGVRNGEQRVFWNCLYPNDSSGCAPALHMEPEPCTPVLPSNKSAVSNPRGLVSFPFCLLPI